MKREERGITMAIANQHFQNTGVQIVYSCGGADIMSRTVFSASLEARLQDGATEANGAFWSNVGECFRYINVQVTGRKTTDILGNWKNGRGTRCKVTFYGMDEVGRYVEKDSCFGWIKN
jgi:hypothetical protein